MSIKRFCDECGLELTRCCVSERLVLQHGGVRVSITVATMDVSKLTGFAWNSGNVCEACVRKTCAKGEIVKEKSRD